MSRTEQLQRWDREHVWHPFTQMAEWTDGLVIERAEGNYLIDTEGRRYFDGVSSLWVTVHGHGHPKINAAVREQLSQLAHSTLLGLANVPSIELARLLMDWVPKGLTRVFYSDCGSTAVEIALKQAFQYWQHKGEARPYFGYLQDAYHGDTLGAVGVGGLSLFHEVFGPLLPVRPADLCMPTPASDRGAGCKRRPWSECLGLAVTAARSVFERRASEMAALIVEPVTQGAAGMLCQPAGYLAALASLCQEFDVLLIVDEVATGFGRTGTMFACEQEAVDPDFLCVAKGLSGGYLPLAATLTTDRVFGAFLAPRAAGRAFFHGHTYTGNPLACAAALANLRIFAEDRVLEQLPAKIDYLAKELAELESLPTVAEIRQRGLMVGIELVADRQCTPLPAGAFTGSRVCTALRRYGVILRPLGDVVVMMPPLSVSFDELALMVRSTKRAIEETI